MTMIVKAEETGTPKTKTMARSRIQSATTLLIQKTQIVEMKCTQMQISSLKSPRKGQQMAKRF